MKKRLTTPQITHQLRRIIFDGAFPIESISIQDVTFDLIFSDTSIPVGIQKKLDFFDDVVLCSKISGKFISELPHAFFNFLITTYSDFQLRIGPALLAGLPDFVQSIESRSLWRIYKNSKPEYVMHIKDDTLNTFQKHWIMLNSYEDAKNQNELIGNIFDSLKPWLDKELWHKIREQDEGTTIAETRENVFFDNDAEDARLRAKAQEVVAQRADDDDDTPDTIILEDN